MRYLPPFVAYGTHALDDEEIARHAADYRRVLEALRDDTLDREVAANTTRLNADLDGLIELDAAWNTRSLIREYGKPDD